MKVRDLNESVNRMKYLMEYKEGSLMTEEINIDKIQKIIDGNQFLKGTKVKEEDLIVGDKYILFAPQSSLDHIRDRHQNANAPGSLITVGNLKDIVKSVLSTPGVPRGVEWLDG